MRYQIEFSTNAEKQLKCLEKKDIELILKKLNSIREDPFHFLERLEELKLWKLRIGDYRAIITINAKQRTLFILKVGHRKNIYKKLNF